MAARPLDRIVRALAVGASWAGGIALIAIMALTCVSVIGRALGLGPVNGDVEAVEILAGFAIFAFLPLCHLERGNATVDLLAALLGPGPERLLGVVADLLMLGFALLLAWRLWLGMSDKRMFDETTLILAWPVWLSYGFGFLASIVLGVVALFCLLRRTRGAEGPR